ncbi:RcnB family protein [Pseudomonas sp. KFB-139]|uniref:RcnB family protein n=1 Tax=Pseudomonas serbiensis TaxID=3064350 RepID=A0ABT9CR31_9PSED|nr:RcnB family protein [Pseudomonas sp. KFB-138]MDO7927956.1 RcnB family protein [Pseudomonas sp. KFB-138]
MNSKSLIACLTLLGCFSVVTLPAQAEQKVEESADNMHELELGSRAPQQFQRTEAAITDWKSKGLPEPAKESQWVRIHDKYVRVQITNGQIVDIVPASK